MLPFRDKKETKLSQNREKAGYEEIIDMNDGRINVMLLGTSGCGKSTLINAMLGEEKADTGVGEAVTKEIAVYQSDTLPFRMIDTVGYEFDFFHQHRIKNDIAKFGREGVRQKNVEKLIHMIWYCIDGTGKRIDQSVLEYIKSVSEDWKGVPIILVFTKSYSEIEEKENIDMAKNAIHKYNSGHLRNPLVIEDIVPVVAKIYPINEAISVSPRNLDILVEKTNELAPKAIQMANSAVKDIDVRIKRSMAQSIVVGATTAAAAVGAIPIPTPDAAVLVPVQTAMMGAIAKTYGIKESSQVNEIINSVLKVGMTTIAGRTLLSQLKLIPGLAAAGAVLNAVTAGVITFAAGEICITMFERIYKGDVEYKGVDWEAEVISLFSKYMPGVVSVVQNYADKHDGKIDPGKLGDLLSEIFGSKGGKI